MNRQGSAFPGTQGYSEETPELLTRYEEWAFDDIHATILHLVPEDGRALDIGAGTGRDAAGLAARGNSVLAVEPTDSLREAAMRLHPSPAIEWLSDGLPDLVTVRALGRQFDFIIMTAVWMHLDLDERARAMPHVASLLAPGGVLAMTLRHGTIPEGRRMFEVNGAETIALAGRQGLSCVLEMEQPARRNGKILADVSWTRLAFRKDAAA